jgi:AcrR family transcriptional regulator
LDAFSQKGFRGTKTREIAERAGISETLIFRYFPTKEDLYRTAIKESMDRHPAADELREFTAQRDDQGLFTALAKHIIFHVSEDPKLIRLAAFSALEEIHLTDGAVDNERLTVYLANYIKMRIEEGTFRNTDPHIAARLFVEALFMHSLEKQVPLTGARLQADDSVVIRTLVDIFLTGLRSNHQ